MQILVTGPARSSRLAVASLFTIALSAVPQAGAQVVRSAAGATVADILPTVDLFRADLGAPVPNNNTVGGFGTGRREINWEGVGAVALSPNPFPGNFFNLPQTGRARGSEYTTPGTGLGVNANGENFANIDPSYTTTFAPFSGGKMFTPIGSNVVDVTFFSPGTSTRGLTTGFGSVFSDVDVANTTTIEFFGITGNSLGLFAVPNLVGSATQQFLGVTFDEAIVHRVRITNGNTALGAGIVDNNGSTDLVVMDDFIYGEVNAVPEPSTWMLLGAGLVAIGGAARRRSAARA